jgi:hypothetical protein
VHSSCHGVTVVLKLDRQQGRSWKLKAGNTLIKRGEKQEYYLIVDEDRRIMLGRHLTAAYDAQGTEDQVNGASET